MSRSDDILGLKPGQSISMKRHGEMGRLYNPLTKLTRDEWRLHAEVFEIAAALPAIEDTREEFVRLLRLAADKTVADPVARELMVEHVLAYADELHMIDAVGPH